MSKLRLTFAAPFLVALAFAGSAGTADARIIDPSRQRRGRQDGANRSGLQ